jgi:hypothetical protein
LAELNAKREANVHAVDYWAMRDAVRDDVHLVRELVGIGGGDPASPDFLTRND